jgi:hypothetical protein
MLELLENQATSGLTAPTEERQKSTTGAGNVTIFLREIYRNYKKYKWQPRNREADRRDSQPAGNDQVPAERGGSRCIH